MSDHDDIQHLDPDQLLTGFSKTRFSGFFLLSIILHAAIIAAFSLTAIIEIAAPSLAEPEEVSEAATGAEESDDAVDTEPAEGANDDAELKALPSPQIQTILPRQTQALK